MCPSASIIVTIVALLQNLEPENRGTGETETERTILSNPRFSPSPILRFVFLFSCLSLPALIYRKEPFLALGHQAEVERAHPRGHHTQRSKNVQEILGELAVGVSPQVLAGAPRTYGNDVIPFLHNLHEEEPGHFSDEFESVLQHVDRCFNLARLRSAF
jgi:hypothetical protein